MPHPIRRGLDLLQPLQVSFRWGRVSENGGVAGPGSTGFGLVCGLGQLYEPAGLDVRFGFFYPRHRVGIRQDVQRFYEAFVLDARDQCGAGSSPVLGYDDLVVCRGGLVHHLAEPLSRSVGVAPIDKKYTGLSAVVKSGE